LDGELLSSWDNPKASTKVGMMYFALDKTDAKVYLKDISYSWSNSSLLPVVEEEAVKTQTIDFATGENIDSYNWGYADNTWGYDESEQAGYLKTGSTGNNIQLKIKGDNFVPDGYKWYHVTYKIKNGSDKNIAYMGRLNESSSSNEYTNLIVSISDAMSSYGFNYLNKGDDTEAPRFVHSWSDWSQVDYYINDDNGTTTVYVFLDGKLLSTFENATATTKVGMMYFALDKTDAKVYLKDIAYSWSNNDLLAEAVDGIFADAEAINGRIGDYAGTNLALTYAIRNYTDEDRAGKDAYVIAAIYSGNKLIGVDVKKATIPEIGESTTVTPTVSVPSDVSSDAKVYVMLWNADSINPIAGKINAN
jgi:hypothetical protein